MLNERLFIKWMYSDVHCTPIAGECINSKPSTSLISIKSRRSAIKDHNVASWCFLWVPQSQFVEMIFNEQVLASIDALL